MKEIKISLVMISLCLIFTACDLNALTANIPLEITPTPTSLIGQETNLPAEHCILPDEATPFRTEMLRTPNFVSDMTDYLNKGGTFATMQETLAIVRQPHPILLQTTTYDVTGDELSDLFLAITIPYDENNGETYLLFFVCIENRYEGEIVFRRGGAGSRSEGLYAGGGARIDTIRDLNGDKHVDVVISATWPNYGELYALTWQDQAFKSLITDQTTLGERRYWIQTHGQPIIVADQDDDSIFEISVVDEATSKAYTLWYWDGQSYRRRNEDK